METRRARPWLGTFVEIRVTNVEESAALRAIEGAFAEIADVQRLMSFHDPESELSRINREAAAKPVRIHARVYDVLSIALHFAEQSRGLFDPTIAAELVEWGLLPAPATSRFARIADWRDVELTADDHGDGYVYFKRPLWLDLGGIAKGYAVDRAIDSLLSHGITDAAVNAGGDLRLIGMRKELVHLRSALTSPMLIPALELTTGSVATSAGGTARRRQGHRWIGPHVNGRSHRPMGTRSSVSVVAEQCVIADALTKIVMSDRKAAIPILHRHDATAFVYEPRHGWRVLNGEGPGAEAAIV